MNRESQETGARRGRTYPPVPHKLSQEDGLYVEEANAPIQYFQINGGNFYSAGRDMHNHFYEAPKPTFDLLSALDSIDNFRQIQQDTLIKATPKTGEWVFQHEMFPVWRNPKSDVKTLWGSGIPGAGKTVITSIIINGIEKSAEEQNSSICVCYIYIRYSDNTGLTIRHYLEVLVKQAVEKHPECLKLAEKVYANHACLKTRPTEDELLQLLKSFTTVLKVMFFFLDALDEAPPEIQFNLIKKLSSLDAKLFITSRPLKTLEERFLDAHHFLITAQDADLDLHINSRLDGYEELRKVLEQGGATLYTDIVTSVKRNCGGMFLHASLQLAALQHCTSVYDVRQILASFPPSIADVYRQTWTRIVDQASTKNVHAQNCIIWVLNSPRLMTVLELQHVAAICLETRKFDPDRLVHKDTLVGLCRGLLVVDEETALVRLVHYTAKETLERLVLETFPRLHSLMASLCMDRLLQHGFQDCGDKDLHSFFRTMQADPILRYAHETWSSHVRNAIDDPATASEAKQFVRGCQAFPADIGQWHQDLDVFRPLHVVAFFGLPLSLAGREFMNNLNAQVRTRERVTPLHLACMHTSHLGTLQELLSLRLINVNTTNRIRGTPLIYACRAGNVGVAKLLLAHPKIRLELKDRRGLTAFLWAARNGDEALVEVILAHSQTEIHSTDVKGRTALCWACNNGNVGMLKLLLSHSQSEIHLADKSGRTPLSRASSSNCVDTFSAILSYAHDDVNLADNDGRTPLSWASSDGDEETVRILLAYSVTDVNQADNDGRTPLSWAAGKQRAAVVSVLLANPNTNVNLTDRRGWAPLARLFQRRSWGFQAIETLRALLAHPQINVNLADNDGLAPLSWALDAVAREIDDPFRLHRLVTNANTPDTDCEEGVTLLLSRSDIDINAQDIHGRTPLSRASESIEKVAKLLLSQPHIQVNLPDREGRTPLIWVAMQKRISPLGDPHIESIVQALLSHPQTDINLADNKGRTALNWASKQGHKNIVALLLSHSTQIAAINQGDDRGRTALAWASKKGHKDIVDVLLAHPHIQPKTDDRLSRMLDSAVQKVHSLWRK